MTYFLKNGNTFRVSSAAAMDLHELLPVGNYIIKQDMFENLFLEAIDEFELPSKLYGDTTKNAARIVNTFMDRDNSTGIMLNGEKGSGKTLLAKTLSVECAKLGAPTIVINAPWRGDKFNQLIQSIEQPCVVLFDEFEKVYDKDDQEAVLTLLDGVFPSKKMFIITCNDKWRVDQHMRNRPGRIFYMLDFAGLDMEFIREYCGDNLKNKQHIEKICQITSLFASFNFDMLKALVEEMNRYNDGPQEALRMLNAKPEFEESSNYTLKLIVDGKLISDEQLSEKNWRGNPLQRGLRVSYDTDPKDDDSDWEDVVFSPGDLHRVDADAGRFEFKNKDGQLVLTRIREKIFNYYDAF